MPTAKFLSYLCSEGRFPTLLCPGSHYHYDIFCVGDNCPKSGILDFKTTTKSRKYCCKPLFMVSKRILTLNQIEKTNPYQVLTVGRISALFRISDIFDQAVSKVALFKPIGFILLLFDLSLFLQVWD